MTIKKICFNMIFAIFLIIGTTIARSVEIPISIFSLDHYNQNVDYWLPSKDSNYSQLLLKPAFQKEQFQVFLNHFLSTMPNSFSPWNEMHVNRILTKDPGLFTTAKYHLYVFNNQNKKAQYLSYGENFHIYPLTWIKKIAYNMNLEQFKLPLKFSPQQRGILINNTMARILPTNEVNFYNFQLPGEGYPFDNLQESALWAGTPVYIVAQTKDHSWSWIITPEVMEWVESNTIAKVNDDFIQTWEKAARSQLAAIVSTGTPIIDEQSKAFQFIGWVGAVFPVAEKNQNQLKIMIPVKDAENQGTIHYAWVNKTQAKIMPIPMNRQNIATLLQTLKGRPYGWGGLYYYNDCSAELKSLFTPFGLWLPRNSKFQECMGKMVDKSNVPMAERIKFLMQQGHPLTTIVDIKGHVFLYLGNYANPNDAKHTLIPMTYQNMWGLAPKDQSSRAVIGQSVFFPLLASFPENKLLDSQANHPMFRVIFLDQSPLIPLTPECQEAFKGENLLPSTQIIKSDFTDKDSN